MIPRKALIVVTAPQKSRANFLGWRKKQLLITQQARVEEVRAKLPALTHLRKELFND